MPRIVSLGHFNIAKEILADQSSVSRLGEGRLEGRRFQQSSRTPMEHIYGANTSSDRYYGGSGAAGVGSSSGAPPPPPPHQFAPSSSNVVGPAPSSGRQAMLDRRNPLIRQHRSMDIEGVISDHHQQHQQQHRLDDFQPLSVATSGYSRDGPSSYMRSSGPLSNPTASGQRYWNDTALRYDGDQLGGGLSLQQEFAQLKSDYATNLEKLNQTMNSIRQFWSPELKRERQMRREEATRIAQLERMLAAAGGSAASVVGGNAALQMEIAARDERIRQLTAMLDEQGPSGMLSAVNEIRYRELEQTVEHLQEMVKQAHSGDQSGRFALETALRRLDEKNERIARMEEELTHFRAIRSQQPRDFTDKTVSNHDLVTMRMKMERSEIELSERKQELASCQVRLHDFEDENMELKSHLQAFRDNSNVKEHTNTILQGDVEALRKKLEAKHQMVEQRDGQILRLEKDLRDCRNEGADRLENVRQTELRMTQVVGRLDGLENTLRDKDNEIDRMKQRLMSHPDVIKEKELMGRIEKLMEEKRQLEALVDDLRRTGDKERQQQLETYQTEANQLKANIENLQKELADRDILLESQNEKIGDLGKEVQAAKDRLTAAMVDKGADELRKDLEQARSEIDKLLKMVRALEREKDQIISQYKQLRGSVNREARGEPMTPEGALKIDGRTGLVAANPIQQHSQQQKRIEELEEALRESVSITAEREVHLAQQKHLMGQVSQQFTESKREIQELKRRMAETGGPDREATMRAIDAERRQHVEQLLQLKQETLLAAIQEKDAHLALLEKGRAPREEIETVRRHRDALIAQLKQENERRTLMMCADQGTVNNLAKQIVAQGSQGPIIGMGAPILPLSSSSHPIHVQQYNAPIGMLGPPSKPPSRAAGDLMATSAEMDDSEGIWA
ncbi:unnamed protein product, partial [Mesorhabditis belari]|uniref:Uncharacterized protein n=1 Tax=Mesorhabditis belari TaxID=2138241 RepID=A0AAF3EMT8_9BILA